MGVWPPLGCWASRADLGDSLCLGRYGISTQGDGSLPWRGLGASPPSLPPLPRPQCRATAGPSVALRVPAELRSLPPFSGLGEGGGNRARDAAARRAKRRINRAGGGGCGRDTSREPGGGARPACCPESPCHAVSAPGRTRPDQTPDPPTPRRTPTPRDPPPRKVLRASGVAAGGAPFLRAPVPAAGRPRPSFLARTPPPSASRPARAAGGGGPGRAPVRAPQPPALPLQMPRGGALLLASLLLAAALPATPGLASPVSAGRGAARAAGCGGPGARWGRGSPPRRCAPRGPANVQPRALVGYTSGRPAPSARKAGSAGVTLRMAGRGGGAKRIPSCSPKRSRRPASCAGLDGRSSVPAPAALAACSRPDPRFSHLRRRRRGAGL